VKCIDVRAKSEEYPPFTKFWTQIKKDI